MLDMKWVRDQMNSAGSTRLRQRSAGNAQGTHQRKESKRPGWLLVSLAAGAILGLGIRGFVRG